MADMSKVTREQVESLMTMVRHELVDVRGDLARVERTLVNVEVMLSLMRPAPPELPAESVVEP